MSNPPDPTQAQLAEPSPKQSGPAAAGSGGAGGFLRDWVLPVVLGLALGGAAVGAWKLGRPLLHSKAWNIVEKWQYESEDGNDAVLGELRALGPGARADLVAVLTGLPAEQMEVKVWTAHQLAGEPWFDTASLKELVRDAKAAVTDRRAAACALVDAQSKEVDVELVLPVFEAWLRDTTSADRGLAVNRIDRMWRAGMLGSQWEGRIKHALLEMIERVVPARARDAERLSEDRAYAVITLELALPDDDVKKALWAVAKADDDDELPRVNAVRALSEGGQVAADSLDGWAAVAKSSNGVVRQATADNLFRAKLPEFDKVLEPLQFDANPLTRTGALDTQTKRRRPTMLARFDELLEDSYEWTRFGAMFAAGVFKNETEGLAQRAAMMLRLLESSEDPVDVKGAVLAMKLLTDEVYGFQSTDVELHAQNVEEGALRAFMADKAGRKDAADKWRAHFGAAAVWTDGDRIKTLEKLLASPDPKNVERAKLQLEGLRKK